MVVQFIKANATTGELLACAKLPGIEVVQMGRGFVPPKTNAAFAKHCESAHQALEFSRKAVSAGYYDLIVLDEICGAVAHGLIEEKAVIEALNMPGRRAVIVLTGRDASARLIAQADTVTEMKCVKHGYEQGISAQKGVEL
jgi:cob(I)alamin adenosyltransferase